MTIKEWMIEIRRVNAEHGWESKVTDERPEIFSEKMLLIVSEIIEAMEEYRNHRAMDEIYVHRDGEGKFKPEGIPIELADTLIRIFDFAEANGIDLEEALHFKHEYNKKRSYRHGGKKA